MKNMRKMFLTTLLALACAATAAAQGFLEYGVTAGINIPDFSTSTTGADVKNRLGWQVGLTTRINTPVVAIQPELLFVRQSMEVSHADFGEIDVKSNSVELPVLASVSLLRILRINVGPVFSLVNNCKYKYEGEKYDFGRLRPTIGYALGAAVKLNHLLVDARFNGQFGSKRSVSEHPDILDVKVRSYSVAFSIGYVF